jgi:hypothetical protein
VVGCGASAALARPFLAEHPNFGIMTLNRALGGFPAPEVACFMHYEPILLSLDELADCGQFFLPDPCPVGVSNALMAARDLYPRALLEHPAARIFQRITDPAELTPDGPDLLNQGTVATVAFDLLHRCGIREVVSAGVAGPADEGTYARSICSYPALIADANATTAYPPAGRYLERLCAAWGMEWRRLR